MSERLNNNENLDAEKWKNINSGMFYQQITDRMDNITTNNSLKENSKKQKEHFEQQIFATRAAVLQSYKNNPKKDEFIIEQEKFETRQAAKENHEKYGENITSEAARRCFSKEFIVLKNKFEKVKRAETKEKEMSIKDSQKSYKKRLRDGIIMTVEDRKHLLEMDGMDEDQREEYGRKKRQAYMEIQAKRETHPIKFRQLTKKHKLSIPKEWDDSSYSLSDFRQINSALIRLDDKYKS